MPPSGPDPPRQGDRGALCHLPLASSCGPAVAAPGPNNTPMPSQANTSRHATPHPTPPPTPLGSALCPQVYRLITKNSVDQNIYNLSQRKLRMDSAVLDGITTGKGGKADETQQMGFILHSLIMGPEQKDEPKEEGGAQPANGTAP